MLVLILNTLLRISGILLCPGDNGMARKANRERGERSGACGARAAHADPLRTRPGLSAESEKPTDSSYFKQNHFRL